MFETFFHHRISSYCLESFPEFLETFQEQMKFFLTYDNINMCLKALFLHGRINSYCLESFQEFSETFSDKIFFSQNIKKNLKIVCLIAFFNERKKCMAWKEFQNSWKHFQTKWNFSRLSNILLCVGRFFSIKNKFILGGEFSRTSGNF